MKTCETTLRLPRRILLLALLLVLAIFAPYPAALVRGEDPTPAKDAGQPKAKAGEERAAGNLLDTVTDVDLKKFGWTRHGGAVVSDGHDVTSLMLPYLPPDEYDLTAEFSRLTNDNDIVITFPVGAGTCAFSVGAHNNKHAVLGKIARHWDDGNPTLTDASVANNEKHQMEVKVRRDVVEGYLDGKRLCRWLTNGDDLMSHPYFMPHNPGLIALTGWQGAVAFYSVKVTAVHGQGIAATERDADGLVYNPRILRPGEDGSIQLAARDATVHGKAMNYDGASGQECLEYREPTGQYLSWFVEAPKEGDYGVDVTYACSDGKDGSDVEVGLEPIKAAGAAPSAKLVLHVKDSGGWEQLQSESLGKLHLPAGRQMLTVRVKSRPHDAVMNLRRIVLLAPIPGPAIAGTTQPGDKSPAALYLLAKKNPENLHTPTSLLEREIYRQALLIAARDGVGVQTRDESLREWHDDAPAGATLNLDASGLHLEVFTRQGAAIWRGDKPRAAADQTVLNWNIAGIEPLARGEFVKLLQARGFSGKPNVMKPGAAAPADAEARLGELEELSQFNLLRDTHALIHDDGESEARLGVLVRAYANLGQLTRYHWSVEHQVFAARSLLYAQRMVANDPKSAVALWHRAYAMAMAGAQGQAMKDLAAAAQLGDEAKAPPWVRLLQPFCNYDFTKLTDLAAADKSQSPLAMYLAFVTVEQSGSTAVTLKVEKAALDANTRCLRVIDAMCNETGPGLLNQLVDIGPGIFSSTLGTELEKTPGLPKAMIDPVRDLRRADGNPAGRETICQALIAQGAPDKDRREPSLAALGRLIQETTFTHVRRKAHLIAMQWGVDASDYVADVRPLVSEHRFKGVIDAYGKLHEQTRDNAIKAMGTVRWEDLTVTELPLYRVEQWAQSRGEGTPNDLLGPIFFDMDAGSFDKEAWIAFFGGNLRGKELDNVARDLRSASPQSPAIVCADILNHWDITKARQWENAHPDYPSIQLALGMKYKEVGLILDSMRCLKQYTKLSPDMKGYEALAELYRSQGQDEQWVATLQEFLDKTEAVSLEHAQVQYQIANYYMDKGKYKEAAPFADAAAETGAAWGLSCAAQAHTGLGEFARAEQLLVEEMEHYSTSPYNWYAWCVETGRGHRDAARSALAKYLREKGDTISQEDLLQSGIADWVEGKPADGIAALQKRMARAPGPLSLVHLLVLADEADEAPTRDAAVKQIAGLHDGDLNTIVFAKELGKAIGAGPDGKLDLAAVDAIISKTSGADQIEFRALTARYLLNHKQKDSATRYVKACYGTFRGYCVGNLLVYQTSRDLGLDPLKLAGITPVPSEGTP